MNEVTEFKLKEGHFVKAGVPQKLFNIISVGPTPREKLTEIELWFLSIYAEPQQHVNLLKYKNMPFYGLINMLKKRFSPQDSLSDSIIERATIEAKTFEEKFDLMVWDDDHEIHWGESADSTINLVRKPEHCIKMMENTEDEYEAEQELLVIKKIKTLNPIIDKRLDVYLDDWFELLEQSQSLEANGKIIQEIVKINQKYGVRFDKWFELFSSEVLSHDGTMNQKQKICFNMMFEVNGTMREYDKLVNFFFRHPQKQLEIAVKIMEKLEADSK